MKKILLVIICTLPMLSSHAEILFYCKTTNGKQVKVEKHGDIVSYAFGRSLKKPELALQKHVDKVPVTIEPYAGGGLTEITITNGNYTYQLFQEIIAGEWNKDGTRNYDYYGGVIVYRGKKRLVELKCIPSAMSKTML